MRRALGIRRTVAVDGIAYQELTAEPLWRSLSPGGPGYKEYQARFADGTRRLIRCTRDRVYADVAGPVMLPRYRRLEQIVTPGSRILDVGCGTGYASAWLAERVASSGAVVAIDPDEESVEFASKRYPVSNLAFDLGLEETLAGETDGVFDGVIALGGARERDRLDRILPELWRVLRPDGWLALSLVGEPKDLAISAPSLSPMMGRLQGEPRTPPTAVIKGPVRVLGENGGGTMDVLLTKPEK